MTRNGTLGSIIAHPDACRPFDPFDGSAKTLPLGAHAPPEESGPRSLRALLKQKRLPALDGLRAVAVLMVISTHAITPMAGDLGVLGFFVLSGFLITWLLLREISATGAVSLRDFYARRSFRIIPAYVTYCLIVAGLYAVKQHHFWDPRLTLAALTYTTNYYNAAHHHDATPLSHTWSLAVEEQFYLLWPIAFLILRRGNPRRLLISLALAIGGVCAWRTYAYLGLHTGSAYVYNAFETRFDSLAIGCLLAIGATSGALDGAARRLTASWALPLVTLALIFASRVGPRAYHYGLGFTVESVLLAAFIVQVLLLVRTRAWSWLEHPAVRYVGALSYPLYLYHGLGMCMGQKLTRLPHAVQTVAGLLAILILAMLSLYCVEQPFMRLKKRFSSPRQRFRAAYVVDIPLRPVKSSAPIAFGPLAPSQRKS